MAATKIPNAAELRTEILAPTDAEAARLDAAEATLYAALAEIGRGNDQTRADHKAAAEAARAALQPVPPMPELDDGRPQRDAIAEIIRARSGLETVRLGSLADALPRVVSAWHDARQHLDGRAREIADAAEALAGEYAAWWSLLHDARHAEETHDPNHRVSNGASERMRPRPAAPSVLEAAAGIDLCGVLSAHTTRSPITGKTERG